MYEYSALYCISTVYNISLDTTPLHSLFPTPEPPQIANIISMHAFPKSCLLPHTTRERARDCCELPRNSPVPRTLSIPPRNSTYCKRFATSPRTCESLNTGASAPNNLTFEVSSGTSNRPMNIMSVPCEQCLPFTRGTPYA